MFSIFSGFFCRRNDCLKTEMSSKSHISKKCLKNMLSYIMFRRRRWRLFFHATWLSGGGGGDKTFSIGYVLYFSSICLSWKATKRKQQTTHFLLFIFTDPRTLTCLIEFLILKNHVKLLQKSNFFFCRGSNKSEVFLSGINRDVIMKP